MSDTIEPPADKPPAPDYQSSYDRISPYNPASYVCTGYGNEPYEYFDGTPGTDRDHRFTIDLEEGSMDQSVSISDHSKQADFVVYGM